MVVKWLFYVLLNFQVVTKVGVIYGDMFRYATDPTLKQVWSERMEREFDSFPTVIYLFITNKSL